MVFFDLRSRQKTNIEILQKIRIEQKSVYALEHMLGNTIKELEELRPHQEKIQYIATSDYEENPDLTQLSYWSERMTHVKNSLRKREKNIIELYQRLYAQIVFKMLEGEALTELDIFFYQAKPYISKLKTGELTFQELEQHYDWKNRKFED